MSPSSQRWVSGSLAKFGQNIEQTSAPDERRYRGRRHIITIRLLRCWFGLFSWHRARTHCTSTNCTEGLRVAVRSLKGLRRPAACCCCCCCSVWKTRHSVYFGCEMFDRCSADQSHSSRAIAHVAPVKWTNNCPETPDRLIFVGGADCTRHISRNILVSYTYWSPHKLTSIDLSSCVQGGLLPSLLSVCLSVCLSRDSHPLSQYVSITASPTCAAVYVTD